MHKQLFLLGQIDGGLGFANDCEIKQADVDKLKRIMIRHCKSQRIGGEVALALPDCDCRTVLLDMSADEKVLYDDAACEEGVPFWLLNDRALAEYRRPRNEDDEKDLPAAFAKRFGCCRGQFGMVVAARDDPGTYTRSPPESHERAHAAFLRLHRKALSGLTDEDGIDEWDQYDWHTPRLDKLTKIVALLDEIRALITEDKDARAIIFTAHDYVQKNIVEALGEFKKELDVYEFNKQTQPTKRHKIIKEFQNGLKKDGRPKVCVATYATAAVGVTLTAANRVFLMEPSADPAVEMQAAGRIHRLGQTKEVLIKRFAFRNTIEHAIVDLHEEIKAKRVVAGAGKDDPVVKSVLRKHNQHIEVHMPVEGSLRSRLVEQRGEYINTGRNKGSFLPSKFWRLKEQKCAHCTGMFEVEATKHDVRPSTEDPDWPHNQGNVPLAERRAEAFEAMFVTRCVPCKYNAQNFAEGTAEALHDCRRHNHKLVQVQAKKRWFECCVEKPSFDDMFGVGKPKVCGHIFTEIGQRYPSKPCPTCSGRKWMDPRKNFDRSSARPLSVPACNGFVLSSTHPMSASYNHYG